MPDFWKDKKIIAYIALAHHTRFITPVMDFLEEKGARIKYIVGQAERSQEITAIQLGLSYTHIFDYISPEDMDQVQKNYRRMNQLFAGSLKKDFFLGTSPVTVTDKTLLSTALEHAGFENLFKKETPDICFALHEVNRWGKMFSFWAKKSNVPFFSLQEGLSYGITYGLTGHSQYSTLNLVWGNRIKNKLIHFEAPEAKIHAIGNTHLAKEITYQKQNNIRGKVRKNYKCKDAFIGLLVLSARLQSPDLFKPLFEGISQNKDLRLFVKFHPACKQQQMKEWIDGLGQSNQKNSFFIHAEESTYNLISAADVVILGQKSTTGLESLAFGKPIVKLDFAYIKDAPYSFVDKKVAVKLSTDELVKELAAKTDFSTKVDQKNTTAYLADELADTETSIQTICDVFQKAILASRHKTTSLPLPSDEPQTDWSILIQAPDNPDHFLAQLEAIAVNSEGCGSFETLILVPEKAPNGIMDILNSLQGEIKTIPFTEADDISLVINTAMNRATGEYFIFLDLNLAPLTGWLTELKQGFKEHPDAFLAGGRIADTNGRIANAGVVIDHNNSPVSAYRYLNMDYEPVLKERPFQMTDHFLALKRETFFTMGGFSQHSGRFRFLDACLKAAQVNEAESPVIYLPDLKLIFLDQVPGFENRDDAVYFFAKWHKQIWESESRLHIEDGVTLDKLDKDKLSAAMQTVPKNA